MLAAAIKNRFGIIAKLEKGPDGIFEVTINGDIVYTNRGKCGRLPTKEEILQEIHKYRNALPEEGKAQI